MTLKDQLQQSLGSLSPFSSGEHLVVIDDGSQELRCQLVALDTMACAFTRLALRADSLTSVSIDELKTKAEQLSARLTYLLEPISPIEIDSEGCVVQLRSNPPQKEIDTTSYYELLLSRAGEISLCRYARPAGHQREIISAQVTREVLVRLAGDFSAVGA